MLEWNAPWVKWFVGGKINASYNCLDRHLTTHRKNKAAIIWEGEPGDQRILTYQELHREVSRFANVLKSRGFKAGDRTIIYMPMIPELPIAMLACARIGAVHSVVFGGFAANELALRIDDAAPKVIVSASCGIEVNRVLPYKPMLDRAIGLANHRPQHCVILQRPQVPEGALACRSVQQVGSKAPVTDDVFRPGDGAWRYCSKQRGGEADTPACTKGL